jgi:hypothetical protein
MAADGDVRADGGPQPLELGEMPHTLPGDVAAQIVSFDRPLRFALIAPDGSRLRINGQPLRAGIHVLRDRDEINDAGAWIAYFAALSPPKRVVFSEAEQGRLECPVCARPIAGPAVRCPRCSRWFCDSEDYPCWSSGPCCPSGDGQPTALDAGPDWVPEIFREE